MKYIEYPIYTRYITVISPLYIYISHSIPIKSSLLVKSPWTQHDWWLKSQVWCYQDAGGSFPLQNLTEGGVRSLFFPIRSVSWGISANPHGSFFWPLNISLRLLMILATSDGLWGLCVICWSISGCSYGFQKLVLWEKLQHNLIKRRNIHNKKWLLRSRHFWYHLLSFPSMIPRWREVKSMLPGSSSVQMPADSRWHQVVPCRASSYINIIS